MAVRLVCRACGKRLKLPDGVQAKRSARCPKCLTAIDLTPALEASAYTATVSVPEKAAARPAGGSAAHTESPAKPAPKSPPKSVVLIGEDDPLPYDPAPRPAGKGEAKAGLPPVPTPGAKRQPAAGRPPRVEALSLDDEPLSLDDDTEQDDLPPELVPFRVPVRVLADSLRQVEGECYAVIVPHGVFLEVEPMKPLLYVPVRCAVDSPGGGELTVLLPDRRAVTVRFGGRSARALARDTRSFLAGARPAPVATDYRLKWWMLWPALIFSLGLAAGPLVLSQAADLGPTFGLLAGAGFALAGLIANAAVVFFSRRPVLVQMLTMAGLCAVATGLFLFGATAYLAGRQKGLEEARAEAPPQPPPQQPQPPPDQPPEPPPTRAPSHLDRAKKNGASTLDDGPADVTALALAADNNTLGIGYADGTTRLWPLDQATFDAVQPGPRADGPVLRVQFDQKNAFVYAHTATGVIPAPRSGPAAVPVKIPGTPVAISPNLADDRVRFAAIRGNSIQARLLDAKFIRNPPVKGKGDAYALPNPKTDEILPKDGRDLTRPAAVTFMAWGSGGRLLLGQPNGTISIWSSALKPEAPSYDHKAPVKAWASCFGNGDFATGDEKGGVALWPSKGSKPTVWQVFDGAPVAGLVFNSTGSRLAVTDNTGWLMIWDASAGKALYRVRRPAPVRAMAYGPGDDYMTLAAGKTVEVWWVSELVK